MTIIYYIGTKDQYTKDYELTDNHFERIITSEFIKEYPSGFTITTGTGYYKHASGGTVVEKTYIVTVLDTTIINHDLIYRLNHELNQECIAVQVLNDSAMFI